MIKSARIADRSASEVVYSALRAGIIDGDLPGGTPLRQEEIARSHGISKIPVREALQRLEADGLVMFEKNRGAFVRTLLATDVLHFIDIRIALECRALELAIPNMITQDHDAMRALLEDYARQTAISKWSALNLQFHTMLYEPCGNPHLLSMISDLQERIGPYVRRIVTKATGLERPMAEHTLILDACTRGDTDDAIRRLRAHIETTRKEVAAYLRRGA